MVLSGVFISYCPDLQRVLARTRALIDCCAGCCERQGERGREREERGVAERGRERWEGGREAGTSGLMSTCKSFQKSMPSSEHSMIRISSKRNLLRSLFTSVAAAPSNT
jgi:hypothetical protein